MKKKLVLGFLAATTVLQASVPAYADNESVGDIVGGIIGGVIGSQIGRGNGNTAAIIIGAVAGTMIGGLVGREMDEADRQALGDAQGRALREQLGRRTDWDGRSYGSSTGAYGSFTSVSEGYNYRTGEYCREYRSVIYVNNRTEETSGVACRRGNDSWYEVSRTEVNFNGRPPRYPEVPQYPEAPRYPSQPLPPPPQQSVPRPAPYPDMGDLKGFCPDQDHRQFYQAKDFAYSGEGLNLSDSDATQWALNYNNSHRCNTLQEYKARYEVLYNVAYAGDGLNYSSQDAKEYALRHVEQVTVPEAREIAVNLKAAYSFAYAGEGLNKSSADATQFAFQWVEGRCENANYINMLWNNFKKEYSFAYSGNGLNMSSSDAIQYAANKVATQTRCGYLLR